MQRAVCLFKEIWVLFMCNLNITWGKSDVDLIVHEGVGQTQFPLMSNQVKEWAKGVLLQKESQRSTALWPRNSPLLVGRVLFVFFFNPICLERVSIWSIKAEMSSSSFFLQLLFEISISRLGFPPTPPDRGDIYGVKSNNSGFPGVSTDVCGNISCLRSATVNTTRSLYKKQVLTLESQDL